MVTKTLVRVSDGAIMSTFAVAAPNDENQPPKKNDEGEDDKKIAAKEAAVKQELDSIANNEGEVDNNMSTTHVIAKAKDEKKSSATGTRRSSRQKRPVDYNDYTDDDEEEDAGSDKKKRRRKQGKKKLMIDLKDVPIQAPILKHDGKKGGSSSKYLGVNWEKARNKWRADVYIDGQKSFIGYYDNEEVAAIDYARAVFKYKGERDGIERLKTKQRVMASLEKIDLTGVPNQQPILKHDGKTDGSSSKYLGVSWDKRTKKWQANIRIDGKKRFIGYYDKEEDAATHYARAVYKYNGGNDGIERLKTQQREKLDLTDVRKQQLIMKPNGKGSSASKYKGVSLNKASNKWVAKITIDGKERHVGSYDNEEDAATDYARAAFKYKGGNTEVKCQDELEQPLNLILVPAIPPAGYDPIKEAPISALKVTGYEI